MYLLSSGNVPIAKGSSGKDARVVRMSSEKVPLGCTELADVTDRSPLL